MTRFAHEVVVYEDPCLGLVELIEAGEIDSPPVGALLRKIVTPMMEAGVDTLVLGCTHYPFVLPTLRQIVGTAVSFIDPAPAVARQVGRVLALNPQLLPSELGGQVTLLTSGDGDVFRAQVHRLWANETDVKTAVWQANNGDLLLQSDQLHL